jgi:hypothetical protein
MLDIDSLNESLNIFKLVSKNVAIAKTATI